VITTSLVVSSQKFNVLENTSRYYTTWLSRETKKNASGVKRIPESSEIEFARHRRKSLGTNLPDTRTSEVRFGLLRRSVRVISTSFQRTLDGCLASSRRIIPKIPLQRLQDSRWCRMNSGSLEIPPLANARRLSRWGQPPLWL